MLTLLYSNRTASLCISLVGALVNFAFAVQLLSAWRSLRWEPESEWEGSENSWRGDGVKLVWGLLSTYFAVAATVCLIGFVGIVKVRLCEKKYYSGLWKLRPDLAEYLLFRPLLSGLFHCRLFVLRIFYCSFRTSVRTVVCEGLSRQPVLMRDLAEMGLSLENCELWFERAVLAFMMVMVVLIVIRVRVNTFWCDAKRSYNLHFAAALPHRIAHIPPSSTIDIPRSRHTTDSR
jgi:hypothetical protein